MARTCTKCGEALIGTGKFCASCGTAAPPPSAFGATLQSNTGEGKARAAAEPLSVPVTRASVTGPAAGPATPRPPSASNYGPPPSPLNPAPPPQTYAAPAANPAAYAGYAPPAQPQGYAPQAQGYGQYAPPAASPPGPYGPAFVVGARVLVQWADGNRYPGIVQQIAQGNAYCLIGFPDGQLRWVEPQYLALAI